MNKLVNWTVWVVNDTFADGRDTVVGIYTSLELAAEHLDNLSDDAFISSHSLDKRGEGTRWFPEAKNEKSQD